MLAPKTITRPTVTRATKAAAATATTPGAVSQAEAMTAAKRAIRKQAAEITSMSEAQSDMFSAMLAEMDSRIVARTDRLLAQHG
jgi:hypothetical protein